MNGRWWVSGYTFEYETDTDQRELVEGLTDAMLTWRMADQEYLRPLINDINAGKFKTAADARKGWSKLMKDRYESRLGSD